MTQRFKTWTLYALALMSAVIAVVMIYGYVQNQIEQAKTHTVVKTVRIVQKPQTRAVVVARRDIYRGETLTTDDVAVLNVPVEAAIVKGVITNPQDVVGKIARQNIYKGEWILPQKVGDTAVAEGSTAHVAQVLEPGHRMFRISVTAVTGLLGLIQPGDHVDVVSTFESTDSRRMISRVIMQNIEVLAVAGELHAPKNTSSASSNEASGQANASSVSARLTPDVRSMITLNVTPKQAEMLALAMNVGVIQLALRNDTDTRLVKTQGTSLKLMERGKSRPPKLRRKMQRETIQILQGSQIEEVRSR